MKYFAFTLLLWTLLASCNKEFYSPKNNPKEVFNTFWKYTDENYVYFDYKNIDWNAKQIQYSNKISDNISEDSLFSICASLLAELKDGHCILESKKQKFQYDYTNGYQVNFDLALIKNKYLNNNFQVKGFYTFGVINDTIGYVYYEKFKQGSYFADVMNFFNQKNVSKIIIDVRNNGGGDPEIAQDMASYFVKQETLIGSIRHKGGKEHDNFSSKVEIKATPKAVSFDKKVNVLTNRKSFSASSYFAGMVNSFPKTQLIGQITGGGGGAAAAYELSNGWVVKITSNYFQDKNNNHIENGVAPNILIENTISDISNQTDKMLEKAIEK
jgi:C-terminal processing protease CtpA/Prc